jgi:hypothetical protein
MEICDFTYQASAGFSVDPLPQLDSPNTVVFIFGSPEFIESRVPLNALRDGYPSSLLVGCSTAGEILGKDIYDECLVISVMKLGKGRAKLAYAPIASPGDSRQAGAKLAMELKAPDLKGVFILSDGLQVNGTELALGINSHLPPAVKVSGGLAGDGSRFQKTWVLKNGIPISGTVSALGLYGNSLRIGHGSRGGWDIFGPERLVTRSHGNILYELDGKPALALYKEYLGERAAELPSSALLFPLSLRADNGSLKSLVRTVLGVDEAAQSMTAMTSAGWPGVEPNAAENLPMLAIAISCVGRRLVLGQRAEDEAEAALNSLPPGTRQIGFYSYGELSPTAPDASCELHNQTMTYTTILESDG